MSYAISLSDPTAKETLDINITYNYSRWYSQVFPNHGQGKSGIRSLYGMSGKESIPVILTAISRLEKSKEELTEAEIKQYEAKGVTGGWIPTKMNAIRPLYWLLAMAYNSPDGIWEGD